jgi:hypothetical protein
MLRLRNVCRWGVLAIAAGLTMANGPAVTGQGWGQGRTDPEKAANPAPDQTVNQAWAHAPEHAPTYTDTPEDRMMRELTDDGAHDRSDTQR